tara:strand:- start:1229 stop:1987 length:759 start_codon:yes stop_codon:yes gene_type:complete
MIHYHGVPFSGGLQTEVALQGRHGFVSFAHHQSIGLVAELCQSFAIDNGAFSTWKSGNSFDLEGYAEFVNFWHRHPGFDWYVMPDVIDGDHVENEKMREAWASTVDCDVWDKGVPVWHLSEPLELLDKLVDSYPRIAFGSSGEYSTIGNEPWWNRMSDAMDICCDQEGIARTKLHGLRMLDPTVFSHFPFSSADSTNVGRNCGMDGRWKGPYVSGLSNRTRAMVLMDRIESHASASTWNRTEHGYKNFELIG